MNRSKKSHQAEKEEPKNQAYGTQLPTSQFVVHGDSLEKPANVPVYGTYSPPAGSGSLKDLLPRHDSFAQVFKTNGVQESELRNIAEAFQTELDQDGESFEDNKTPNTDYKATVLTPPEDLTGTEVWSRKESDDHANTSRRSEGSIWQLQIREKSLKGNISGVRNRVPLASEETVGFLTAFIDDPEVAEYEVLGEIGKGNMGIVYEARQSSLDRELAIKSLKPKDGSSQYEQEMFVSEAVVTANLVHPNIVPIHDLGRTDDGKLFYSMKKVMGVSWDKTIREKSLEENLDIFMKLCDAVAYAHSRGVVNRDLKPENVVVGAYGEVIVLDWGLAVTNELFPKQKSILLEYRGGAGTPVYMAPEAVSEDISAVGNHTDIYLLGAILFEVLEGFPPHLLREFWEIENPNEQFASIVNAVLTNQIERQVTHPGELMDIAFQAMSTAVHNRPSSVEEMQEMIRQFRMTGHAEELYRAASDDGNNQSYDNYQDAVALFSEALRKWSGNERAMVGDRLARKGFSKLALHKGDFDLGLHLIENSNGPEFDVIRKNLSRSRKRRTLVRRTWSLLAVGIILLGAFNFVQFEKIKEEKSNSSFAKQEAEDAIEKSILEQEKAKKVRLIADKAEEDTRIAEGKLVDTNEILEKTKGQVEQEKQRAIDATKVADEKTKIAAKQTMLAATKTKDAAKATMEADVALKKAAGALMDAENAKKELVKAEDDTAQALKDKQEAKAELLETEWKKFDLQFSLYETLGRYEEAKGEIEKAFSKVNSSEDDPEFNALFKKRIRNIKKREKRILGKIKDLNGLDSTQIKNIEGTVISAVVGTSGRVIAVATPEKVEIFSSPTGAGRSLERMKSTSQKLESRVSLEISPDENYLVAIGLGYKNLWSLKGETPTEHVLTNQFESSSSPEPSDSESASNYKVARFSPDSKQLYIISGDEHITLEVYDLSTEQPQGQLRTSIARRANKSLISDFILTPESPGKTSESSVLNLTYLTELGGISECKNVKVKSKNGIVSLDKNGPEFDDIRSQFKVDGVDLRSLKMKDLVLTANHQRMAIQVGDQHVLVLERAEEKDRFPFKFMENRKVITCDNTISTLNFSADGQRLLVGIQNGYFEVWDWDSEKSAFQPSREHKLWNEHRIGGFSAKPSYCTFVDGSTDQIVAIGLSDKKESRAETSDVFSVISWDLQRYSEYSDLILEIGCLLFEKNEQDCHPSALIETRRDSNKPHLKLISSGEQPFIPFENLQTVAFNQIESDAENEEPSKTLSDRRWSVSRSAEAAQFSLDGQRILVAADDRAAHVYPRDEATIMMIDGRRSKFYDPERNVFEEGHIPELAEILFLPPDGRRILTKDYFGSISVWDSSDDEDGFPREVSRMLTSDLGLAVSPNGKWVVASDRESEEVTNQDGKPETRTLFVAKIWKTDDFETDPAPDPVRTFGGKHRRFITAVAVSPESTMVATADRRGHIVLWDLMTAEVVAEYSGAHQADQISGIAFLNENELVSTGYDGEIQRWLLKKNLLVAVESRFQFQRESNRDDYIISLVLSPDRKNFATISIKKELGNKNESGQLEDENLIRLTIWSIDSPRQPIDLTARHWSSESIFNQGVSWSGDGKKLAHIYPTRTQNADSPSELAIYDTSSWKIARKIRLDGISETAARIAFSPQVDGANEERIATFDGRVAHLWNLENGKHISEFRSHETVYSADFSADRMLVATASDSLRLFISDEESENHGSTVLRKTDAHLGRIEEVRFSDKPGSYDFVTFGGDKKIKVWNWKWKRGEQVGPPTQSLPTISLNPLSSDWNEKLNWNSSLDWSSSEEILAATLAGELFVYRRKNEMFARIPLKLPKEMNARFHCCAISKDGNSVAAGGVRLLNDGKTLESFAVIWTLRDGQVSFIEAVFTGQHSSDLDLDRIVGMTAVQFGPDGSLLTGGTDGAVLEWDWSERLDESSEIPSGVQFDELQFKNSNPHGTSTVTSINVSLAGDIVSSGKDGFVAFWPAIK